MQQVKLKDCKQGEYIMRKPNSKKVYIKHDYDRSTKRYSLMDTEDINRSIWLKGNTLVFIGFTY